MGNEQSAKYAANTSNKVRRENKMNFVTQHSTKANKYQNH